MPTQLVYKERTDSNGVGDGAFSVEQQHYRRTWYLDTGTGANNVVTSGDVRTALTEILGGTADSPFGSGPLARTLPLADPQFPWLYASSISSVRGVGQFANEIESGALDDPEIFDSFSMYEQWEFVVDCTSRPYPVVGDQQIVTPAATWVNRSNTTQAFKYVNEWDRFCHFTTDPRAEAVTGQQGTLSFVATFAGNPNPNDQILQYRPRLHLPDQVVNITWVGVPFRYLTSSNSYIAGCPAHNWLGTINQHELLLMGILYPAGSLLYLNYKYTLYTPPGLAIINVGGAVGTPLKLCDITFTFLKTQRVLQSGETVSAPPNGNFVVGGWNLQPWLIDRNFHYAATSPPLGNRTPAWYSAPLELLWMDPDAPQPVAVSDY